MCGERDSAWTWGPPRRTVEGVMDSKLFEELCRVYLADQFGVPVEAITSRIIPNPRRPGEPEFSHQIDHYWETGPAAALYVNIANAKWRTTDKADQGEVLAIHAVKELVRAHKALLITSTDFTAGARGFASQHGIGLHVVRPTFDCARVPLGDRAAMRAAITSLATKPYTFEVVHRGLDLGERPAPVAHSPRPAPAYTTRELTGYATREGPGSGSCLGGGGGPGGGGIISRDGGGFNRGGSGGITRR